MVRKSFIPKCKWIVWSLCPLLCCFDLEYNDLKTELKDYLKRFADEGTVSRVNEF